MSKELENIQVSLEEAEQAIRAGEKMTKELAETRRGKLIKGGDQEMLKTMVYIPPKQ